MSSSVFHFKQFSVHQELCGMKVGTDGTLLGAWAHAATSSPERILDIGTGTGLIALMLAQRFPSAHITAIDIDEDAATQARTNAAASPFAKRMEIVRMAIQDYTSDERFDIIVCNPPYFEQSLTCPDNKRSTARHTATLSFPDLMKAVYRLLSPDGIFSLIVPFDAYARIEATAILAGLFVYDTCTVKTGPAKPPKRIMLSFGKQPPKTYDKPAEIIIGSEEYKLFTKDFYL